VLVACWFAASRGVSGFEDGTFRAVNTLPGWLYPVVWPIMQMGNVAVAVVVAIVIVVIVRKPRLGIFFVVTPIVAWFLAKAVKAQVQRGRPEPEGLAVTLRGPAEDGFGFISGHATVAFAVAAVAMPHLRRPWNFVALALAVVVGVARLYVGAHLPLDVVGGAACGLLIGELVRVVEVATRRRPREVDAGSPR
jgi:undecaprenyl-diphosphatase